MDDDPTAEAGGLLSAVNEDTPPDEMLTTSAEVEEQQQQQQEKEEEDDEGMEWSSKDGDDGVPDLDCECECECDGYDDEGGDEDQDEEEGGDDGDEDEEEDEECDCEECVRMRLDDDDDDDAVAGVDEDILNLWMREHPGILPPSLLSRPTGVAEEDRELPQLVLQDTSERGEPVHEDDLCAICYQPAGTKCPMLVLPCCHKATSTSSHFCTSCIVKCFRSRRGGTGGQQQQQQQQTTTTLPAVVGECPLCKTLLVLTNEVPEDDKNNDDKNKDDDTTVAKTMLRYPTLEQKFLFVFHAKAGSRSMLLTIAYASNPAWLPSELLYGDCVHGKEMARQFLQWGLLHRRGGSAKDVSSSSSYHYSFPPDQQCALQKLIESSNLCIDEEGDLVVKVSGTATERANRRHDFLFCISGQIVVVGVWTALKRRKLLMALRLANHAAILLCVSFRLYPWLWDDPHPYRSASSSSSCVFWSAHRRHRLHGHVKWAAYTTCNLYLSYKLVGLVWRLLLVTWHVAAAWGAITVVATAVNPRHGQYRRSRRWKVLVMCSLVYYGYHYHRYLEDSWRWWWYYYYYPSSGFSKHLLQEPMPTSGYCRAWWSATSTLVRSGVQYLVSGGGGSTAVVLRNDDDAVDAGL
jgi:hypothetical protein